VTPMSMIKARPVRWAWDTTEEGEYRGSGGRFPIGTLAAAAGIADLGKSTFGAWISARVSRGELPGCLYGVPRGVIYAASEDDYSFTIRPRLEAAGADLDRVYRVDSPDSSRRGHHLNLPDDIDELKRLTIDNDVALIVFDPLMSNMSSSGDSYKQEDVRLRLHPVIDMLSESGALGLAIMHFRKMSGEEPLHQITGSTAWGEMIRSAVGFVRRIPADGGDPEMIMSTIKNNLGRGNGLASYRYELKYAEIKTDEGPAGTSFFEFAGESPWSMSDVLNKRDNERQQTAMELCANYLRSVLDSGKMLIEDVMAGAEGYGYSNSTWDRARKSLRIQSINHEGKWWWSLT
jgi:hypothetical protein